MIVQCSSVNTERHILQWVTGVDQCLPECTGTTGRLEWSAKQIIGPNNVYPAYGHLPGAWSMNRGIGYIDLSFDHKVRVSAIHIYETYNSGSVVAVSLITANGGSEEVFKNESPSIGGQKRIFEPNLKATMFYTKNIRLDLNCQSDKCDIDAVGLTGTLPVTDLLSDDELKQWAEDVTGFSSEASSTGSSARQVLGAPNIYPLNRFTAGCWLQSESNTNDDSFIELWFVDKVNATAVEVYETGVPGGVTQVALLGHAGFWEVVWDDKPTITSSSLARKHWIELPKSNFFTRGVRVKVDRQGSSRNHCIDAVRLIGKPCFAVGEWADYYNKQVDGSESKSWITTLDECKSYCLKVGTRRCYGIAWHRGDPAPCHIVRKKGTKEDCEGVDFYELLC